MKVKGLLNRLKELYPENKDINYKIHENKMKDCVQIPDAILDYTVDLGPWLGSDTITLSNWVAESPMSIPGGSESNTDTTTTLFLEGGVDGDNYTITNNSVFHFIFYFFRLVFSLVL